MFGPHEGHPAEAVRWGGIRAGSKYSTFAAGLSDRGNWAIISISTGIEASHSTKTTGGVS